MPFDEEESPAPVSNKKSLKINNDKSIFVKKNDVSQEDFEKNISNMQGKSAEYALRAAELSSSFRKILDDKSLVKNKNVFQLDVERQILESLIQLSIEMNEDEDEKEAMGATGLVALLLKTSLIQRDRINNLDFNSVQLESKILILEEKLAALAKDKDSA
jgi:hypothetical protein